MRRIELCAESGEHPGMRELKTALATEFPNATLREWGCLGNCRECFQRPFALIDDVELVRSDSAEGLLEQIRALDAGDAPQGGPGIAPGPPADGGRPV